MHERVKLCPLFQWVDENYAEIDARITELLPSRPDWSKFAEDLAKEGVVTANGFPPNGTRVQKAWAYALGDRERRANRSGGPFDIQPSGAIYPSTRIGWVYALGGIDLRGELIKVGHSYQSVKARAQTIRDQYAERLGRRGAALRQIATLWVTPLRYPIQAETKAHKMLAQYRADDHLYPREVFRTDLHTVLHAIREVTGKEPHQIAFQSDIANE